MENLSKEYDIDYSNAHRADEDCVITHYVYEYLTFGYLLSEGNTGSLSSEETIKDDDELNSVDETLIEADLSEGWKAALHSVMPAMSKEFGLFDDSLSIKANLGKDQKITSYGVYVYEPDLVEDRKNVSRNTILARVKEDILKTNPNIVSVDSKNPNLKEYGEATEISNGRFSVRIDKNTNKLVDCLIDCIRYGINNYTPKAAGFACCARYKECSKEGKCIHPNYLYAKACEYRKNLEKGRIFY
ncbi:MAG: hypothetical protein IKS09_06595 [Lachnospiraceae bacterium]|nr:hypothetical protein [Lachnospiraceae bacterium]